MPVGLIKTGADSSAVYTVNGGAGNAPDWLARKGSKKGKSRARDAADEADPQGIRLIQDLDFPEASNRVKTTRDGRHLIATGTYKPRMKVFELEELGLKFERTTDAENVDFEILSDDWTKTVHLQADRSVEIHNQACAFYRTRIPKAGRALAYHYPSADALVGGLGGQVFRLNLEQGRFLSPFSLHGNQSDDTGVASMLFDDAVSGVNAIDVNPAHQLLAFGTENLNGKGTVEFWDHRARSRAGILTLPYAKLASSSSSAAAQLPGLSVLDPNDASLSQAQVSVSALASRHDGLNLAVGTSTGHTLLYDLRSPRPYTIKDQGYGLSIKKLQWPLSSAQSEDDGGPLIASADEKVVKIWSAGSSAQGKNLVAVTAPVSINDMHIYPNTGLMFLANEQSAMTGYYIPKLGQAPKWCRFLDNMTEEMEDDQQAVVYDDYKFVDRKELQQLNLEHLVGTDTLRPFMHGFFIDLRLYSKAKTLANPFAYAEYRQKLINDKLEKERESRIRTINKGGAKAAANRTADGEKITVNKSLVEKLRKKEEKDQEKEKRKRKRAEEADGDEDESHAANADTADEQPPSLLADSRFSSLFTNSDFAIDESSREFAMLNPSAAAQRQKPLNQDEDGASEDEDESGGEESDSSAEGELITYEPAPPSRHRDIERISSSKPLSAPTMAMEHESGSSKAAASRVQADSAQGKTFGELARRHGRTESRQSSTKTSSQDGVIRSTGGGNMEFTFNPSEKGSAEHKEQKRAKIKEKKAKSAQFGYGLEKGASKEEEARFEGEDGSGRKSRRHVGRSASNSALRKMAAGKKSMQRK